MFLVTGATGGIGRRVVRLMREREMQVRAFVRLTSRYSELEHRGCDIFIGDLRQEKDIQKACQGVQYIISTHGSNGDAMSLDYRANIELIDSAIAVGVQHFVFISVLGADRGYEDAPVFKAKRAVERYLEASGLNYTILHGWISIEFSTVSRTMSGNRVLCVDRGRQKSYLYCKYR